MIMKVEKPVKEMNYEMNVKYYLRVRGYGQSFRMLQEFVKRGWRKTVFARPKEGDREEWRLMVQDVPARMRVDYPKDSIAVELLQPPAADVEKQVTNSQRCHECMQEDPINGVHGAFSFHSFDGDW